MRLLTRTVEAWRAAFSPPGEGVRYQRVIGDVLLWMALSASVLLDLTTASTDPAGWVYVAAIGLVGVAVAIARSHPLVALSIPVAWSFAVAPDLSEGLAVPMLVLSFLVGRRMPRERPAMVAFGAYLAIGTLLVLASVRGLGGWFSLVTTLAINVLFAWLVGRYWRQRHELVTAGWMRAEQLEREQRVVEVEAWLRERTRIAGDMHDSLGHELSLLALRAAALEVAPDLAERHRAAAAELRVSAGAATERLRQTIGVLRTDGGAVPTEPADETIEELVRRTAASGVDVALELGLDSVPPGLPGRAAYRVVQESLTNATKHAPGGADHGPRRALRSGARGGRLE